VSTNATALVERFDTRTSSSTSSAGSLSGGNQQKVIVARELSRPLTCFMASQPTRGLDVGSIEYVHRQIVNQRNEGLGVFIISSELDEVVALGDRIAVMYAGRITGVVGPTASREDIGLLMAGATSEHRG
jgi:simple sugar transport system ATP-binding protein